MLEFKLGKRVVLGGILNERCQECSYNLAADVLLEVTTFAVLHQCPEILEQLINKLDQGWCFASLAHVSQKLRKRLLGPASENIADRDAE